MCVLMLFLLIKMKNTKAVHRKKTTKDALSKASANHNHIIGFIHFSLTLNHVSTLLFDLNLKNVKKPNKRKN